MLKMEDDLNFKFLDFSKIQWQAFPGVGSALYDLFFKPKTNVVVKPVTMSEPIPD